MDRSESKILTERAWQARHRREQTGPTGRDEKGAGTSNGPLFFQRAMLGIFG